MDFEIREWEARAAQLETKLTSAVGASTEQAAEISADLVRLRELIRVTREIRRMPAITGAPCGASAFAEQRNHRLDAADEKQFKFEAEQRLAQVTNE